MTPTPATEFVVPLAWRSRTLSDLGDFKYLAEKDWNELQWLEIFPGCPLNSPKLVMPEWWFPPGATRRASFFTLDPSEAGVPAEPAAALMRDEAIRRALLALWLPLMMYRGVGQYSPTTWISYSGHLLRIARWQFDNMPSPVPVFGDLTAPILLTRMFPDIGRTDHSRKTILRIVDTLIDAGRRGIISDWPRIYERPQEAADAPTIEEVVRGAPELLKAESVEESNWQSFSDEFVSRFIGAAIWIIDNLAEQAIDLWLTLRNLPAELEMSSAHPTAIEARSKALNDFDWRDSNGSPIKALPFSLHYQNGPSEAWPPRHMKDFNRVISLIQALVVSLVAFCTAARQSEIAGAKDTELQTSGDRFHSRTYKMVGQIGGAPRDWPLHPVAVRALVIQQKLSRSLRPAGTDHLWTMLFGGAKVGQPLLNLTEPLVSAVEFLGLSHLTGADRAHLHRWRHTVARLIATSIMSAPQVLLDLLGHANFEMVLTYMCSDPDVVERALKVAREYTFAVSGQAVEETIEGLTSGPAAVPLQEGLLAMAMRRGDTEFGTASMHETIEVLTFDARTWSMVRPGVICTKGVNQFGPCTRGRGAPDPATCRTNCDHRLEMARAKRDCNEALASLAYERAHAQSAGESMLVAHLDGIIVSELGRWEDVRIQMLSAHPDLRTLWETRA